jgi:hypothetical protein
MGTNRTERTLYPSRNLTPIHPLGTAPVTKIHRGDTGTSGSAEDAAEMLCSLAWKGGMVHEGRRLVAIGNKGIT